MRLVRNDYARRALARAETRAEAFALLEKYSRPIGDVVANVDFTHDAFLDEQDRLREQEIALQSGDAPTQRGRDSMTDIEYDRLFA